MFQKNTRDNIVLLTSSNCYCIWELCRNIFHICKLAGIIYIKRKMKNIVILLFYLQNGVTYNSCSVIGSGDAKCATAVDANGVATSLATCVSYSTCTSTQTGKTCQATTYKVLSKIYYLMTAADGHINLYAILKQGVLYPAGTCIYQDGLNNQPWCSLDSAITNDAFTGSAGQTNWDYCNCSVGRK